MQRTLPSTLLKVFLVLIALGAVWLAVGFFEYLHERKVANAAIRTVGDIKVGESTQEEAELMLKQYAQFQVPGVHKAIQLAFVNRRWLEPVRSPSQWIYLTVEFTDGIVSSRSFQFLEQPRRGVVLSQHIHLPASFLSLRGAHGHRRIGSAGDPASPYFVTDVREDLGVPDEQRSRDWQFNLQCFKFMTRCGDLRAVLEGAHLHMTENAGPKSDPLPVN